MDLETVIPSEVSQTKTNVIRYHFLYVETLKKGTNERIYKIEIEP